VEDPHDPGPGEPGSETCRRRRPLKRRRLDLGSQVTRIRNEPYLLGTGNAAPWFGDQRPGDNSHTSVIALTSTPAQLRCHHQCLNTRTILDWDEVSPPIVVDYQRVTAEL
jgi:alcohol dehydrogenase (cytochrome c)